MPLASYQDANEHLDGSKIAFTSDADAAGEAESADVVVKAKLGSRFPDYVILWDYDADVSVDASDLPTPQLVREAASLLMAAFRYQKRYSEETLEDNDYATRLEARAMKLLDGIADGSLILWDVEYGFDADIVGSLEQDDFWPNDKYTPEYVEVEQALGPELAPKRSFTMDKEF